MLLEIIPYGNPILRRQAEPVNEIDDEVRELISDMKDTIRAAKGVGLAAPQVNFSKKLLLIDWSYILEEGGQIKVYINPEILDIVGSIETEQEGCLSLPEVWADVVRHNRIRIKYIDPSGEEIEEQLSDLPARVFQHEYDHLLGILFIDRISRESRNKLKEKLQGILDGRIKPFDGNRAVPENEESEKVLSL